MANISAVTFLESDVPLYCEMARNGSVVVVDTETTGFADTDDIVQLAVLLYRRGQEIFGKSVYLRNQIPIDGTEAQQVNHITDALLAEKGLEPKVVLEDFLALLDQEIAESGKVCLVAHNLAFDWRMIANMLEKHGCRGLPKRVAPCCTREFVKALRLPKTFLPSHRLKDCISALGLEGANSHDALDDARACAALFRLLTE